MACNYYICNDKNTVKTDISIVVKKTRRFLLFNCLYDARGKVFINKKSFKTWGNTVKIPTFTFSKAVEWGHIEVSVGSASLMFDTLALIGHDVDIFSQS